MFRGPITNINTIRVQEYGKIQIQILFGFGNLNRYKYEYYLGSEIWPNTNICHFCMNTNTQIIQIIKNMNANDAK